MRRRDFNKALLTCGLTPCIGLAQDSELNVISVDELPELVGEISLYLGRGEGGLYENVLKAISDRNPKFKLNIRRGPTAALANAIITEKEAGIRRADVFWAVDAGAIGLVVDQEIAEPLPSELVSQLRPNYRYRNWLPVSGRIRTLPFNTSALGIEQIPQSIMSLPDEGFKLGWAPEYASFQSFITAMRLLAGNEATSEWLLKVNSSAKRYAGELGVVMGVERGEVDIGFANHYYTLRLKAGKPDAMLDLAFTKGDSGCLVNASGILALTSNKTVHNFIRYLFTKEVQSYLSSEAFEIPLVDGIALPRGIPSLDLISPPAIDLTQLSDLRPTLDLMRELRVL